MTIEKEVKKINNKFIKLTRKDNGGIVLLISGIVLCSIGIILITITQDYSFNLITAFLTGLLITEILLIGFMLIHKSLRGKWL